MTKPTVGEAAQIALSRLTRVTGKRALKGRAVDPYCLHPSEDYFPGDQTKVGHFHLVNRDYDRISQTIPGSDPRVSRLREASRHISGPNIYLFNDGTRPYDGAKDLNIYRGLLKLLCSE